ncbi:MAG: carbohydrate kinase family protein [Nocardioides sp.]
MSRILVVGDVVDDIVVRPLATVTEASDTDAEIRRTDGGSAANVAAWLGHLGAGVRFVGRAGTEGAERHRAALAAYGVDARVSADPNLPTATLVATLDPSGERTMYVDRAANARLRPDDLGDEVLDDVGWLHLTGYSLFDDAVRPAVLDLADRARAQGCGVSVDPSSVGFLSGCGAEAFLGWVAAADLHFPNLDEGRFLTGTEDPLEVVAALAERLAGVVLTLGASGASYADADGSLAVAARPADVRDTTGAGDAFCAGFLSAWTRSPDPTVALAAGATAAARAVSVVGGRPRG